MTPSHPTEPHQTVAVLGLPELARCLSQAGLDVVTGEPFRSAAAATNARLREGPIPLIFADVAVPGTTPWVIKALRSCRAVLIAVDLADDQRRMTGITSSPARLTAPVSVDEVLDAVGVLPLRTRQALAADGSVSAPTTPAPLEDSATEQELDEVDWADATDDDWPEPTTPAPLAPDAPPPSQPSTDARPAPVPAPPSVTAPRPQIAEDFWSALPSPLPANHGPATPAPAAEEPIAGPDLWEATPTPVAPEVASQRPAPQLEVTEPQPTHAAPVGVERLGEPTGYSPALGRTLAPCLLTLAGKGGVGKSSLAYALAQRAAVVAQMRAVLVDGNRGQGDLRTYLALNRAGLPTIYDAVTTGDPSAALITPERLNANRPHDVEQLSIALVQAPPHGMTDPTVITAGLYHDVITRARTVADLVVIDTQIIEGAERGMVDDLIVPMLASHAYGLGISDLSRPGIDNLLAHLGDFIAQGVPVERLMTMLNRVPSTTAYDLQRTSDALTRRGAFIAAVPADAKIHESMSYGTPIHDNPVLAPVLDQVLYRVTGHRAFAEQIQARAAAAHPDAVPRRRLWGRR